MAGRIFFPARSLYADASHLHIVGQFEQFRPRSARINRAPQFGLLAEDVEKANPYLVATQ
jgi:hypothetical protein